VTGLTGRPPVGDYLVVGVILTASVLATAIVTRGVATPAYPESLIPPVVSLVALTGAVLFVTAVVRNLAVFRGTVSQRYYRDYVSDPPGEKLERPARAFDNLLQVPMLFYAACALMIASGVVDSVQVKLAWLYTALRALHAVAYIGWNRLAYRFALFGASCIVLGVLWTRFAMQSWPG
jgi:hypothetical protein